jgi:hypothetical protein
VLVGLPAASAAFGVLWLAWPAAPQPSSAATAANDKASFAMVVRTRRRYRRGRRWPGRCTATTKPSTRDDHPGDRRSPGLEPLSKLLVAPRACRLRACSAAQGAGWRRDCSSRRPASKRPSRHTAPRAALQSSRRPSRGGRAPASACWLSGSWLAIRAPCLYRNSTLRAPTRMGPASVFPRVARHSTFGRAGRVQTRWGAQWCR